MKSRISFDSIGSTTLWPSCYAPEKATLEHLVQENEELRRQIDTSQINISYTKMLKYFEEHTMVYVAPDREVAKRCTQLAAENERQAEQIATLSAQLSDSASASDATHLRQTHPGSGMQRLSQIKGTQDLSGNNQQLSNAYKAAPNMTYLQVSRAPSHTGCCAVTKFWHHTVIAVVSLIVTQAPFSIALLSVSLNTICLTRLLYTSSCCTSSAQLDLCSHPHSLEASSLSLKLRILLHTGRAPFGHPVS